VFDGHCPILIVPRHIGMASIKLTVARFKVSTKEMYPRIPC